MKSIKICYTDKANVGDAINPYIVRNVLHYEPVLEDAYHCQITGIGSGLRRFFISDSLSIKRMIRKEIFRSPVILWSAGFLSTPTDKEFVIRKKMKIASVRGKLSKEHIERILGYEVDCTTGDAGLLCSRWIPQEKSKKYKLGIIPHIKEKGESIFEELQKENRDSVIIDVEDDPVKILKTISSCECIVSSSLHGLIIADSYCVPNKHIVVTDKLVGDGFKFKDYYSAFGLKDDSMVLEKAIKISVDTITNDYRLSVGVIEKKQVEIIDAFHQFLTE